MAKVSTSQLHEKDRANIWHAMRADSNAKSVIAKKAEGAWITDSDGNKYLDGMAGLWCVNAGYGRKELADVAYEQLMEMPYFPLTQSHEPAIELAEKLNEWLGDDYVYFFSNSGSEANETAFKIARQYHHQTGNPRKYKFIARYRAYHGNTMATMAAGGQNERAYKYEPFPAGFLHVTPPDSYRVPEGETVESWSIKCANEIEQMIKWEVKDTVAAVIMEPMITGGGILIPHDSYMRRVREICDEYNVLLISDEVINGFGRTGKRFGFQHSGVKPDIISMAKGITSAYLPLSATAVRKEIFEAFQGSDDYNHLRHVNTFGGNPAACKLAIKNLEIMEEEKLVERSAELGERLLEEMAELKELPYVGDVRGRGLLFGIEMVKDKDTKEPLEGEVLGKIVAGCKQDGLIIAKTSDTAAGNNNILTLSPPLSITEDDFQFIVKTVKKHVKEQVSNA
ncbi:Adenosylmethionine-8-amino-7-oxononanoate aminotransferase [Alteribacillus iranensis]|uniref:Adenosylmethionine-8-amino-7-oxononanoate aminotransferase n=2 Tax=Alteribacillus iranensis TaxID=930128 RepID=A0A1I2BLC5_9BACI|nr:aspartate aminotransferase family protein [Alteribacillus iranensis]SFE56717.1 Adenosylmethionine-8-amino-7-oxononanoate aminotransferase [Alteribacillus iranensis]